MTLRRLALPTGVVALGLGAVALVEPGLIPLDPDRFVVSLVGVLALVQALRVARSRYRDTVDEADTPDPERPVATPTPGDELETAATEFLGRQRAFHYRTRIEDGLRTAARTVLTRYGPYSDAEARALLETGAWTDDPYAAGFLGDVDAPSPSLRSRIRGVLGDESSFQRSARRTVDEIAAKAGSTPSSTRETAEDSGPNEPEADGADLTRPATTRNCEADVNTDGGVPRESGVTGHWRGVSVVALVGIGVGILVEQPAVLLAAVVGVGFAAYARSSAFVAGDVSIERRLGDEEPEPGDEVEVTVTVSNDSDRFLPDLRVVDGVPEALAVTDGSPRCGTALRPGASTTFTYSITARRGVHRFEPTLVLARDLSAERERELSFEVDGSLTCRPLLRAGTEPLTLRERTSQYVGQVETSSGGEGIEFYATRDYQPGDARNRIDWNHRARTGELTTVEFRKERAATVVLVIDARTAAYVAPAPYAAHAVDRSVEAAGQLFATLSDAGNRVGIAALGAEPCWLPPSAGVDHSVKARELLATHPALSPVPTEARSAVARWRKRLRKRLSPGTQLVFLTPLSDDYATHFARRFDEYGHPVTVVSPDPTVDRTAGHRLAGVARTIRTSTLRSAGIPVIDWPSDEPVDVALARYDERWSR